MHDVVEDAGDELAAPAAPPPPGARATAALAVLAGISAEVVAARDGVSVEEVDRWVRAFVAAGSAALDPAEPAVNGGAGDPGRAHDRHVAVLAHELRSPVAMIRGWTELVAQSGEDDDLRARALRGILAQADRLGRLADDALDAVAVARGQVPLAPEPTTLASAVARVVGMRSLDVPEVRVDGDAPVRVDPDRFAQVLDNLLDNARKHGGGVARLTVRRDGPWAELEVTSTGAPVPPQVAHRLFGAFQQGEGPAGGVGLGLYVCRSLVAAHGGEVGLRVTAGTNGFWVRLPVDADRVAG